MLLKQKITIPRLTGRRVRNTYVYLPLSYDEEPGRRYPVLYMFDGQNVFVDEEASFGKSWGMLDYLDFTETEIIVAAVECNTSPDNGRLKEYSPYDFSGHGYGDIKGKGKKYMDWLAREFKRDIDESFRTIPDREHTFIAGSSMGGLMSLYALMAYNNVFSRAAALSPSLWTNPDRIKTLIKCASLQDDTILYMDYGSEEMHNHPGMRQIFTETADILMKKNIFMTCRTVPHGIHSESSWEKQLPFMMETLMYDMYDIYDFRDENEDGYDYNENEESFDEGE
ncbi:MAG: alpha/beta hydrolase [Parasporobacterium sp.]|nr:alpha/beta hydrolase [Parasporobacterium sp.]